MFAGYIENSFLTQNKLHMYVFVEQLDVVGQGLGLPT